MTDYLIIALLSGLLLYFIYKFIRIKIDIRELNYNIKNKIEYRSINESNRYINKDLVDLLNIYDELILENNKLSIKNSEIEDNYKNLMANISHDLRTPLTSIMGYIALAKEEDSENREHYLEVAEKKSLYLNKLIEKFYELSLLSNGKINIEKNYVNIINLIYSAGFEYYDIFKDKNQTFEINACNEVVEILTSEKLLDNIIHNVLDNMIKYSLGDNRIDISENNDMLIIEFSNKVELEDGDYSFLFERSRVLDNSRNSSTGIGLSIVDLSMRKLGYTGKIYVKNNTFYFEIKIKK